MDFTIDEITVKLETFYNPALPPEYPYPFYLNGQKSRSSLQKAAVLLPFLRKDGKWHLLFIRRTQKSDDLHSGQVAFPGGRCDPADHNAIDAAFREMVEETGVAEKDIHFLGRLRDLVTVTRYQVTPIVGTIPWPYPLIPQPEEVSRIFTIPFEWLADPANRRIQQREHPDSSEKFPVIYFKPYDGEVLWGASARITHLLLEALGFAKPENRYSG